MPKWNEYTEKELPVDNDVLMIEDSENSVNKILKLKKLADWIVGKVKKCIPYLENHTAVSDSDYVILGQGTDAKKITVAELKTALGIDTLNTNLKYRYTISGSWLFAHNILGMGLTMSIPKHYKDSQISISKIKVYNNAWYDATVKSTSVPANQWIVTIDVPAEAKLEYGKTYIVAIDGSITY